MLTSSCSSIILLDINFCLDTRSTSLNESLKKMKGFALIKTDCKQIYKILCVFFPNFL
jgi:hypothetical protein